MEKDVFSLREHHVSAFQFQPVCYRALLLTVEISKLQVVVVQRQVVLHGREAAGPGGQVSHTLVLTVQHLSEMVCNKKV